MKYSHSNTTEQFPNEYLGELLTEAVKEFLRKCLKKVFRDLMKNSRENFWSFFFPAEIFDRISGDMSTEISEEYFRILGRYFSRIRAGIPRWILGEFPRGKPGGISDKILKPSKRISVEIFSKKIVHGVLQKLCHKFLHN